ncbi:hypothetical protein BCR33DRAFT_197349 [Rhizoclosmatium globosum]|uniref:Uncharacterized protein n=1 Tax=Rhizoclosmatium globosum TaxID=329046 RepID=A0A1Y2CG18_9FUNG|nr:hypothetical protein BCR33DRAFT_197349 [Rhizoclosmatium globosum]|eukprot:ORY45255.1 hypothetical protein BCR33DRAFT_197349 [Rhizoclosmatium globosum]
MHRVLDKLFGKPEWKQFVEEMRASLEKEEAEEKERVERVKRRWLGKEITRVSFADGVVFDEVNAEIRRDGTETRQVINSLRDDLMRDIGAMQIELKQHKDLLRSLVSDIELADADRDALKARAQRFLKSVDDMERVGAFVESVPLVASMGRDIRIVQDYMIRRPTGLPAVPVIQDTATKFEFALRPEVRKFTVTYERPWSSNDKKRTNIPTAPIPTMGSLKTPKDVFDIFFNPVMSFVELNKRHKGAWRQKNKQYEYYTTVIDIVLERLKLLSDAEKQGKSLGELVELVQGEFVSNPDYKAGAAFSVYKMSKSLGRHNKPEFGMDDKDFVFE